MFGLGSTEVIVIGIIVLLIFGAKRLPEIGKGLGGALREFRNIKKEIRSKETAGVDPDAKKALKEKDAPQSPEDKSGEKGHR